MLIDDDLVGVVKDCFIDVAVSWSRRVDVCPIVIPKELVTAQPVKTDLVVGSGRAMTGSEPLLDAIGCAVGDGAERAG